MIVKNETPTSIADLLSRHLQCGSLEFKGHARRWWMPWLLWLLVLALCVCCIAAGVPCSCLGVDTIDLIPEGPLKEEQIAARLARPGFHIVRGKRVFTTKSGRVVKVPDGASADVIERLTKGL